MSGAPSYARKGLLQSELVRDLLAGRIHGSRRLDGDRAGFILKHVAYGNCESAYSTVLPVQ